MHKPVYIDAGEHYIKHWESFNQVASLFEEKYFDAYTWFDLVERIDDVFIYSSVDIGDTNVFEYHKENLWSIQIEDSEFFALWLRSILIYDNCRIFTFAQNEGTFQFSYRWDEDHQCDGERVDEYRWYNRPT